MRAAVGLLALAAAVAHALRPSPPIHDAATLEAFDGVVSPPADALMALAMATGKSCAAGPLSVQVRISSCFSPVEAQTIDA